jgi:glycosyltransferase involved in cell wall biosynthesis
MRLVLDLQSRQTESRYRGIGRYSLALARNMICEGNQHEFLIAVNDAFPEYVDSVRHEFCDILPPEQIVVFRTPVPCAEIPTYEWRHRVAEMVREYFLQQLKPDWVHVSTLFEGLVEDSVTSIGRFANLPTTVTLYDLIPHLFPEQYLGDPLSKVWYTNRLEHLRKADLLLAISEHTRQEAVRVLGLPAERVVNISADADPQFRVLALDMKKVQALRGRYGLTRDIVLFTGAVDFRKNVHGLIEAYAMLPADIKATHQLVISCKVKEEDRQRLLGLAESLKLTRGDVVLTGYIDDEELVALYNICKLFVMPSLYEGFGLPLLEAMRCGAPVIGSNASSIPEVIGLEDALFDPTSPANMSSKLHQALADGQFRQKLRDHGQIQAGKFSWKATAKRALEALETGYELRRHGLQQDGTVSAAAKPAVSGVSVPPTGKSSFVLQSRQLLSAITALPTTQPPDDIELVELARAIAESTVPQDSHQLLVDVSALVDSDNNGTGIRRVTRSVLRLLVGQTPEGYRIEAVYRSAGTYRHARRFMARFCGTRRPTGDDVPVEVSPGDVFLGLHLDIGLGGDERARLWLTHHHRRGLKTYFVVYDILPLLRTDWFPPDLRSAFEAWLPSIASVADGLVCISQSVADELRRWLDEHPVERQRPLRIGYFHLGADIEASLPTNGISAKESSLLDRLKDTTSILMVGILWPRKGHDQLLDAMERLWHLGSDTKLIVVGGQGWSAENLVKRIRAHPELGRKLFWLSHATDELLLKLYRSASALIVPSEGEGFGIPLIEAARHKLPIIARDLPVFREVAGNSAFYFTGTDGDSLAKAIDQWLELYRRGQHPRSDGMRWLTWEESAAQLKRVIFESNWSTLWEPPSKPQP